MHKMRVLVWSLAVLSGSVFSGTMGNQPITAYHPWMVTGSIGYTQYQHMASGDGGTVLGRLALGRTLFANTKGVFGLELGVQNGNTMRLSVPQDTLDILGGLPIQSTVKPMLDLLATVHTNPLSNTPFFLEAKGGIAYRRWQFENRSSINDKSQIAGEIQSGIGYFINDRAHISLLYQGVFGGNPDFRVDADAQTGAVTTIPVQNGVLLSMTFTV